ncbi:MAG: hypothetical protein QNJ51_24440 [Calothrix sp. MO_167.B12]|nr:hypothetical protein [Calothrix sp. MO_167.B12]
MFSNYGVGWVERSETQLGVRKMLGFVPQPNLQLMLILGLKTDPRGLVKCIPDNKKARQPGNA